MIITWRPGLSNFSMMSNMACWISGFASTNKLFCPALGTTRVLPTKALTSVAVSPLPRAVCHGNVISEAVPPDEPLLSRFVLWPVPPASPDAAPWKSMPVKPSLGALMPLPLPASASRAFRISATCTALACFSSTLIGKPACSG